MLSPPKIRSCALDLLAYREHSKFELQQKLCRKGFAANDVKKVIEELAQQGLQSDSRFTESYINMRRKRGFGPRRIQMELRERGIDMELNDPEWSEWARTLRAKKFGEKIPQDFNERVREMRYLYYKGFTSEQIKEIMGRGLES